MFTNVRTFLGPVLTGLAIGAAVLGLSHPASACDHSPAPATPVTVTYSVTDDARTARDLNISYRDNLDYELDATERMNASGTDTICEHFARRAPRTSIRTTKTTASAVSFYNWYECTVPADEAPAFN